MSQVGGVTSGGDGRLARWLETAAPEGQHFDIKRELELGSPRKNVEALKDLTGMGNGGGGTVVFGLDEKQDGELSRVDRPSPLTDRQLVSRLRDLVSDCVRPTLDYALRRVDIDGGFVLVVDVEPSPLGPYMVENLNQFRYWQRRGDRVDEMPERAVADAYAQATRRQAAEAERWQRLRLPVTPTWSYWPHLSLSALPEHEDDSYCDPARVHRHQLRCESSDHARSSGLEVLTENLSIWSDGFISSGIAERTDRFTYGDRNPQATVRIHRGGAIGYGVHLASEMPQAPLRYANAVLSYVGAVWDLVGIRAGEVRIELTELDEPPINLPRRPYPLPKNEHGEPYSTISLSRSVRTDALLAAPTRHQLLKAFADRLANLRGQARELFGFDIGPLYQPGRRTDITAFLGQLRWASNDLYSAQIRQDLSLRQSSSETIGWWTDGLVLDLDGNAVAALEFCTADGLPDGFMASDLVELPNPASHFAERGDPPLGVPQAPPRPTEQWIQTTAEDFLRRSQP